MQNSLRTNRCCAFFDTRQRRPKLLRAGLSSPRRASKSASDASKEAAADRAKQEVEYKDGLADIAFIALCRCNLCAEMPLRWAAQQTNEVMLNVKD